MEDIKTVVTRTYLLTTRQGSPGLVRMIGAVRSGRTGLSQAGQMILLLEGDNIDSCCIRKYYLFSAQPSKKKSAGASKSRNKDSGSLIDFDNNSSAGASKKQDDGWNNNWEDDAWESLNN